MPVLEIAQRLDSCERTEDVIINDDVTFASLTLSEKTLKGLKQCGFEKPSPIQLRAIPLGRCGFDLIVEAKSGTGKTAVFGIITLEMIVSDGGLQALIIAPTREIASQIGQVMKSIGSFYEGLVIETVMGGVPISNDIERLSSKKYQILVGSPGRILHLIKSNVVSTKFVRLFILDEADKLMEKSFKNDINSIFSLLPKMKQFITASATYTEELRGFLSRYMVNHMHVRPNISSVLLGLTQHYIIVPTHDIAVRQNRIKFNKLLEIISQVSFKQCLIFCKYQSRAQMVCEMLCQGGWPSEYLAASQNQSQRLTSLEKLQTFSCRILVATDLASRGIDASNVNLVVNIDLPEDCATYLHRIGRAGRYGSKAVAITILSEKEKAKFDIMLKPLNEIKLTPFNLNTTLVEHDDLENNETEVVMNDQIDVIENCGIVDTTLEQNSVNSFNNYLLRLMNDFEKLEIKIDKFDTIVENCEINSKDTSDRPNDKNMNLVKFIINKYGEHLEEKPNSNACSNTHSQSFVNGTNSIPKAVNKINIDCQDMIKSNVNTNKVYKGKMKKDIKNLNQNGIPQNFNNRDVKSKVYTNQMFKSEIKDDYKNLNQNSSQSNKSRKKTVNREYNKLDHGDLNHDMQNEYATNAARYPFFYDYDNWRRQLNMITSQIQQAVYIETLLKR